MKLIQASKNAIKKSGCYTPVRKLLSAEYRRQWERASKLVEGIERRGFQQLRERHQSSKDHSRKYLRLEDHVLEAVALAESLDLLESRPLRVLDVGCGPGYFLFTLKSAGHDVQGIDVPDTAFYNDIIPALAIPRIVHRVQRFQALPETGAPFDLITAIGIVFDRVAGDWGVEEWRFFIDDCRGRLRSGGRLFLQFNPGKIQGPHFVTGEVAAMLRAMPGGQLYGGNEFFKLQC